MKNNIKIKSSWEEVVIKDFIMIKEILENENKNELEKDIAILAILAGVEENHFDEYPSLALACEAQRLHPSGF